jgi:PAS domain S-box-containing protein
MMRYLSQTCRGARVGADITLAEVAPLAKAHESGLSRFEQGQSYPRDVGTVVDGYAAALKIPAQMIWADALRAWVKEEGGLDPVRLDMTPPLNPDETLIRRIATEVRSATDEAVRALFQTQTGTPSDDRKLLDAVFANVPIGLAFVNPDLRYVRVNVNLATINGFSPEEHYGTEVPKLLPEMWDQVQPCYEDALSGTPCYDIEVVGETPAAPGRKRNFLTSYLPVGEPVIGVLVISREVTEYKRLAELLTNGFSSGPAFHQEAL